VSKVRSGKGRFWPIAMQTPYTPDFAWSFGAAQIALGVTLAAVVWHRSSRHATRAVALTSAIVLGTLAPLFPFVLKGSHGFSTALPAFVLSASGMMLAAAYRGAARRMAKASIAEALAVGIACAAVPSAAGVIASLHVCFVACVIELVPSDERGREAPLVALSTGKLDAACGVLAVAVAIAACLLVTERYASMSDEWAYTYQADLFAHARAYATPPPCPDAFESDWIYHWQGRAFSQFTPGWPLFLAPFARMGAAWIAAPVSHGLMAFGVARLARRVHSGTGPASEESVTAGVIAAAVASVGASALLNAASRFPHTFVAACFVWSIESACAVTYGRAEGDQSARPPWRMSLVLGLSLGWMIATRPIDGLLLGVGVFVHLTIAFVRGKRRGAVLVAVVPACLVLGMTVVLLRLQVGEWFATGYSLTATVRPWAKLALSLPSRADFVLSLPLDTGSYCWWPCAPALGLAGLVGAPRHARAAVWMLASGAFFLCAFYFFVNYPREHYWGYGPRYHLPAIVAMAVGGGQLLAPLVTSLRGARRIPFALAAVAVVVGTVFVATRIYPPAHAEVRRRSAPSRAIVRERIHNAVVFVTYGDVDAPPTSLTQNLAEPNPDVLVLIDRSPMDRECIARTFPGRALYHAVGHHEAILIRSKGR
jgi:hypothetical protein